MSEQTNEPVGESLLIFGHTDMNYNDRQVIYWYKNTLGKWYGMSFTGLPPDDEGKHHCQVQLLDIDGYPIECMVNTKVYQQARADAEHRIAHGLERKMLQLINAQDFLVEEAEVVGDQWLE